MHVFTLLVFLNVFRLFFFAGSKNDIVELVPVRSATNFFIWSFAISDDFSKSWTIMFLACIPADIEGGSSLIGLRKVSDKTVRIAEISFLSFKILGGYRFLCSYLENLYWRSWWNTLISDYQYKALISQFSATFMFVENPVFPPGVFVSLFWVYLSWLYNKFSNSGQLRSKILCNKFLVYFRKIIQWRHIRKHLKGQYILKANTSSLI